MRTFLSTAAALAAAFVMLPLAACSPTTDAQPAITKTCRKTLCDDRLSHEASGCSACLDACSSASYNCDPSTACDLSCDHSATCSDEDQSECLEQGFTVRIDDAISPEVLAACNRMFDHFASCNLEIPGKTKSICVTWARAEKPENAAYYDCVANKGCSDDVSDCAVPTTDFGDDLCGKIDTKCASNAGSECSNAWNTGMNENGGVWRADVVSLARKCLDYPACGDVISCVSAWTEAVGF
jgi:hypothetical protein